MKQQGPVFRVRIGKVRSKDGIVRPVHPNLEFRKQVATRISRLVDSYVDNTWEDGETFAGMALVMWTDNGSTTSCVATDPNFNHIPGILIPEFVKARLMADKIEDWTLQSTREMLGIPPSTSA